MQLVHDPLQLPASLKRGCIALGNFDGVHKGHQAVLNIAKAAASSASTPAGVMIFDPHPREFFAPDKPLFHLSPRDQKAELLRLFGLDYVVVMQFDGMLAGTRAQDFVDTILIDQLGVSHVVCGFNFHFGKAREGSPEFLRKAGQAHRFDVTIAEPAAKAGTPYSSSAIRAVLEQGDVAAAAEALGYWWFVRGQVIAGEKRGRTLGFPTINMAVPASSRLRHGIYAVRVRGQGLGAGKTLGGVASFGVRPTFGGGAPLLETYLFDFSGDLYGQILDVELCSFIRPEEAFGSADDLVVQMNKDEHAARALLKDIAARPPIGEMQRLRDGAL